MYVRDLHVFLFSILWSLDQGFYLRRMDVGHEAFYSHPKWSTRERNKGVVISLWSCVDSVVVFGLMLRVPGGLDRVEYGSPFSVVTDMMHCIVWVWYL